MSEIKVSVIIPVYNVEKYLQSCIDACMDQTLQDIEFIFINDASQDSSFSILCENEARFKPRMKVINSTKNLLQGGARNIGIKVAVGDYIGFVDSDDFPLPQMYELLYKKAEATQADVCFIHSAKVAEFVNYTDVKRDGGLLADLDNKWSDKMLQLEGKEMSDEDREWMMVHSPGHIWNALWSRRLLEKANIFFPEHLAYEDNYWAGIVEAYVTRIAFVKETAYLYRVNQESTTKKRNQQSFYDRNTIKKMLLKTAKERGLLSKLYDAYEYLYTKRDTFSTFRILTAKLDCPDYKVLAEMMQDLRREFPKWRTNIYIKAETPFKERVENASFYRFPVLFGKILSVYNRLRLS